MLIKKRPDTRFSRILTDNLLRALRRLLSFKKLLLTFTILVLLTLMFLLGVYQGSILRAKHMELRVWARQKATQFKNYLPNYVRGTFTPTERIDIDIKHKNLQKIIYKRNQALQNQRLIDTDDSWVPCKIRHNGATYNAKIRLKGEFADHWNLPDGWSYKIKIKGDHTLFGMKRFALQRPVCRAYLDDWLLQALLEHCGLIHLRFDFVQAAINGKAQPIYLLEENYEKRLIENNARREGPILQFDHDEHGGYCGPVEPLTDYPIDAYQSSKIAEDPAFARQYDLARNLLRSFSLGELPASQVFDTEQLATMFAILDLLGAHHVAVLMNLKFYYNPVTSRLEPVAQDNGQIKYLSAEGLWGTGRPLNVDGSLPPQDNFHSALFSDPVFFQAYIHALEKVAAPGFLEKFQTDITPQLQQKQAVINKSEPAYNFTGWTKLYANRAYLQKVLNAPQALTVYLDQYDPNTHTVHLSVNNVMFLPVQLHTLIINDATVPLTDETILQARLHGQRRYNLRKPFTHQWTNPAIFHPVSIPLPPDLPWPDTAPTTLQMQYSLFGSQQKASRLVHPKPLLQPDILHTDLIRQPANFQDFSFIQLNHDTKEIIITPGSHRLDQSLKIPPSYKVLARPGTTLTLCDNAAILSYSPLDFVGSLEAPIIINSADQGRGLVVINADPHTPSVLRHVIFDGLTNAAHGNWDLTSAVTFYQSPVKIDHCQFINNKSEDGLNIIRSEFDISNTFFADTFSDAFDADFAQGTISNSSFARCGNDAVDVSGSHVNLSELHIIDCGDKGISAGEVSYIDAADITILQSEIAVAAKDLSDIAIKQLTLDNCRVAFALYQKKPEYGPALINAEHVHTQNILEPYLVEKGSTLKIDQLDIPAQHEKVEQMLYGVQYGKSTR